MSFARPILLADDDSEDREMLVDAFEEIGCMNTVICSATGEGILSYLDACQRPDQLPCLVVLDLNMPRLNGRQTLQQIKKNARYKHIIVVIYSTSVNPIEKEACLHLGAHSYITKPVMYAELIATVRLLHGICKNALL
jgi:CheY-like chemotaxis protein